MSKTEAACVHLAAKLWPQGMHCQCPSADIRVCDSGKEAMRLCSVVFGHVLLQVAACPSTILVHELREMQHAREIPTQVSLDITFQERQNW